MRCVNFWRSSLLMVCKKKELLVGMLVFGSILPVTAYADEDIVHDSDASVSLRGAYWSATRRQDSVTDIGAASIWLGINTQIGSRQSGRINAWARSDNIVARETDAELREAYWRYTSGFWDLRIGRQLIIWGKADGVNPTDNLAVRNFRLLTTEDMEQKSGVVTVFASAYIGELRTQLLWLPEFRPHTLPFSETATQKYSEISPKDPKKQWAARVERTGGDWDWSLSYFSGYDKSPDLHLGVSTLSMPTIDLVHPRLHVLGADAAGTVGRIGWRLEGAYTSTPDVTGVDIFTKNSFAYLVAGVDRTFLDTLNINFQYVYRYIFRYEDPRSASPQLVELAKAGALANNQFDRRQNGATLRLHNRWLNDTLAVELSFMEWWSHRDYVVKPKMSYAWSDHLKTSVGADIYRGSRDSFLGKLRELSVGYAELQWSY
ncbi:MAG: hypothetical protein AABY83_04330 [Pseudomonadota bacterium]